jgi:antitoxin component YwqK of YwqJK toxin-antitoxin module
MPDPKQRIHTIQSSDPQKLDKIVNEYFGYGWQLVNNGYSTRIDNGNTIYMQVVSYDPLENDDSYIDCYPDGTISHYINESGEWKQWYADGTMMFDAKIYNGFYKLTNPYNLDGEAIGSFYDRNQNCYKGRLSFAASNRESMILPLKDYHNSNSVLFYEPDRKGGKDVRMIKVFRHVNFRDGKRHGKYTRFFGNGIKMEQGLYKKGEKVGLWTAWYENGQKEEKKNYKDGELISEKLWDEDGSVL